MPVTAQACNLEQFAVENFSSEVDQWSDGSGKVVRLVGTISSACRTAASVELLIAAKGPSGGTIRQKQVWMNTPPGGMPFDLAGAIDYDASATRYEVGIARVK